MKIIKRILAVLCIFVMTCVSVCAEESDLIIEEMSEDDLLHQIYTERSFTPSFGSPYEGQDTEMNYWTLPMDISDEDSIWEMLMQPMTVVDIGKKSGEKIQTYLFCEPDEKSKPVGVVTCESQGVHVLETLDNGWSFVECYSSSFHDTKVKAWALLVQGYIRSDYLKTVKPSSQFAIVIDKLTQRLYLFKDGKLYSTLLCSTGLVMWNGKKYQPYNETRSGEFILMSKAGTLRSDNLYCDMAIRFNAGDMIHEVPHVKNSDGSKNYKTAEPKLGTKCSHGCIRVQRNKTPEGINMSWIWKNVKSNSKVKLVIWEDWQGRSINIPDDDELLYYNPAGGSYYHRADTCYCAKNRIFTAFRYGQLDEGEFASLKYCPYCCPYLRKGEIAEINEKYTSGGDHDPLMTELTRPYLESVGK